ncbi:MAG: hypothetical protein LBJ17_08665 [Dysgonamonadaceae bacterium]|jgi:hypothetical protein|nr:hypothetical protein [Dysgonamonadaceae bacterium]
MKKIDLIKKDGEIQFRQDLTDMLENEFETLANGVYTLSIKKKVNKRSPDQNSLMWLWFTCIERETGTDKNDVHDYYCGLFLRRSVVINGKEKEITGDAKVNYGAILCFRVPKEIDSMVVLDEPGAESLNGRGDGLIKSPEYFGVVRFQGFYKN